MSANSGSELLDVPVPGVIRAPTHVSAQAAELPSTEAGQAQTPGPARPQRESDRDRSARKAHRTRLYLYAFGALAVLVYVVGLAASNTHDVRVHWVFGSSSMPLVWLVLFAVILGWLLGLLITTLFHWRTRAPRSARGRAR